MLHNVSGEPELQDCEGKTYKDYLPYLDQPIYEGADVTLRQWVVWHLQVHKQMHTTTDSALDMDLHVLARVLPKPNRVPRSLHILKRLVGVQVLEAVQWHPCPCGKHAFSPMAKNVWGLPPTPAEREEHIFPGWCSSPCSP